MDEAALIDPLAWHESLRPALADKQGWAIFIGTPKGHNWFYDLFQDARDKLKAGRRGSSLTSNNPLIPAAAELALARIEMGSRTFSQEFLAEFTGTEGAMFQREWFETVESAPRPFKNIVRAWDKAGTEAGGDFTVGVLMGEKDGCYYVLDVVRGQWSSGRRNQIIRQTAERDEWSDGETVQIWMEQEPGSGGLESAEISMSELRGHRVHAERSTGPKEARADAFAAQCEWRKVKLVRGVWNRDFLDELCIFPPEKNAGHDDQVDAASMAFNKLAKPRGRLLVSGEPVI